MPHTQENKRSDPRGETTAILWTFLLKAGGRWNSSDVARQTGVSGVQAAWLLSAMVRNGNARRFDQVGKNRRTRFVYGVTGECKVPRAVLVKHVAECVLAEAPDAECLAQQPQEEEA